MNMNPRGSHARFLPLADRTIVHGICGSVSAYKAADLASKLVQAGASVQVLMTASAQKMVGAPTLAGITGKDPVVNLFESTVVAAGGHIKLAHAADAVVIAPATANTIAKLAHGVADDPVCTVALAATVPLVVAPAMETAMYSSPPTRRNLAVLRERGVCIVGPTSGRLAAGEYGIGRLIEPGLICAHLRTVLGANGDLAGRKFVVTAGGTREAIDAVRFLTNASSGKMGYAVAVAARDRGADVVLISASEIEAPVAVKTINVTTADEMGAATRRACTTADVLVMAAAVADFKPTVATNNKLSSTAGPIEVRLTPNQDIIASIRHKRLIKVAFAAHVDSKLELARHKLKAKGAAMIVINDVLAPDSGFGSDTNRIAILTTTGNMREYPLLDKLGAAHKILDGVSKLLGDRQ